MNYLTEEDINYLCNQSTSNLNFVLYGMTSLMESTQEKIAFMESQTWYQRMANTLTGKNKMTVAEIAQNHEKINIYMSEAIAELYNRNCVDHEIILGLGNRINDLLAEQIELKQMLGAFVGKLNQKIISIDNFHMLTTEIEQGVYNSDNTIVSICKIMSQLDTRTIQDQRKMNILLRAMKEAGILSDAEELFSEFLCKILHVSETDAGIIALMLEHIRDEYISEISRDVLCEYFFLPEKVRKMKSREAIVENVLREKQIDLSYKISSTEYYSTLIEEMANNVVQCEMQEIKNEYQVKHQNLLDFFEKCLWYVDFMYHVTDTWEPIHGEFLNDETRKSFASIMTEIVDNFDQNSLMGNKLKQTAINIDFFFQSMIRKYPEIRVNEIEASNDKVAVNQSGNLNLYEGRPDGSLVDKYYSLWAYIESRFISQVVACKKDFSVAEIAKCDRTTYSFVCNFIGIQCGPLKAFKEYYSVLKENILQMIGEDYAKYDDVYSYVQNYMIDVDIEEYDAAFVNHFKYDKAFLSFSYDNNWGCKYSDIIGYAEPGMSKKKRKANVIIKVNNIEGKYTISYKILENSVTDWDTFKEYKMCSVKWGEWLDSNSIELQLELLHEGLGTAKIKVYIQEHPECCGIIEVSGC